MKQPYFVYGISSALVIAIGIIIYITWFKDDKNENFIEQKDMMQQKDLMQQKVMAQPETIVTPVNVKPVLVMFYMDGCGHCTNAMPAFKEAADNLVQSGQFDVIVLENSRNSKEVTEAGVTGFPTFRLYKEGFPSQNHVEYKGNRSTESLLRFVHSEGKDS